MKVAFLTTSYPRNNEDEAGIFIKRLVEALSEVSLGGLVIAPIDSSEPSSEQQGLFTVTRYRYGIFRSGKLAFGSGILPNLRSQPTRILQAPALMACMFFRAFKLRDCFQVVHAHWLFAGIAACLCNVFCMKPYVLSLRGEDVKLLQIAWLKPLFALCFKRASFITTVNQGFIAALENKFPRALEKTIYVPNGISVRQVANEELEGFAQAEGLKIDGRYLLYVGRLIPLKRIEVLIDLLQYPAMAGFSLILCGSSEDQLYLRSLRELTEKTKLSERVIFKGRVPPQRTSLFLSLAAAYISASSYEGRSNSLLEALAAGKVVFASDIQGHKEVINNGENGILFRVEELEELGGLINRTLSDSALSRDISTKARQSVSNYTWQKCAQQFAKIYEDCLQNK